MKKRSPTFFSVERKKENNTSSTHAWAKKELRVKLSRRGHPKPKRGLGYPKEKIQGFVALELGRSAGSQIIYKEKGSASLSGHSKKD